MSSLGSSGPSQDVVRTSFTIGTAQPTVRIENQSSYPWLTVWNTHSCSLAIASPAQIVGALRQRTFYVADEDPIVVTLAWGQRNTTIVQQPGMAQRTIAYALGVVPLAELHDQERYSTPNLLTSGTLGGGQSATVTPNALECFTGLDLAYQNAQAAGVLEENANAGYGQGLTEVLCYPPPGTSRQLVELYGPSTVVLNNGSPTARLDWQIFGIANVQR